eukprot:15676191-Heterocapsa_arctica.AAC.1
MVLIASPLDASSEAVRFTAASRARLDSCTRSSCTVVVPMSKALGSTRSSSHHRLGRALVTTATAC